MKIIKIESGEELLESREMWRYLKVIVEYDTGVQGPVLMSPERYKKEIFKQKLIDKGYDEKDLEEFEELVHDETRKDCDENNSDY